LRPLLRTSLAVAVALLLAVWGVPAGASTVPVRGAEDRGVGTTRTRGPARVVEGAPDGFDWSDGAVGGAGVLGLVLILVGAEALWARGRDARRVDERRAIGSRSQVER
jgi:hypothetical protein